LLGTNCIAASRLIDDELADGAPIGRTSVLDLRTFRVAGQSENIDPTTGLTGQLDCSIQGREAEVWAERDGVCGKR
jgi:hypothetical protein